MLALLLAAFAASRVAVLLATEEGPWEVATWWRNRHTADDWIGRGLRCPACLSFWLALPAALVALLVDPALPLAGWPLAWLGVAGAARWLWKVERDD